MSIVKTAAPTGQPGTGEWENEGGSLKPRPPTPLPEGIIAVTSIHYRVGPYSYSRLEDALAEHRRQAGKRGRHAKSV
ncbi:hypothetical protein IM511_02940 [Erythrobacteraceae bacterium E2-1 Yellow Sea]|nr:hypothetical protein [Erythrobacteraceae bacterium E2-1 Yellow Sea]